MSKKIVIFGIDNFSKKNVGQLECIIDNKFNLDVFTNDVLSNSVLNVQGKANVFLLNNSLKSRLIQIYKYLKNNASDIHHAEIYPGGRFAFVYVLFCKLFKVKMVAVERGDLIYYDRYDKLTKFAMRITYKYSDIIWYRELYMKEILQNEFTTHLVFLHNSINKNKIKIEKKEYNFLWVNRLISERKSNWFIDSLNKLKIEKNIMIGIMNTSDNENYALENQNTFLQVMKYQDPKDYYLKSKFFVLPSDLVFLNNSLLEAMSYGLVPLISDVEGARLIVDDGVSGFVFEHTQEGLLGAMKKAISLTEEEYQIMSKNAIEKVKKDFSYNVWCEKYIDMIKSLD